MRHYFDERGQAAVEAALILPVLLFMLMGMFVVGYWLNAKQVVTAAAREGARVGALTGEFCQAKAAVGGMMNVLSAKAADADIPNPLPGVGQPLTVTVRYKIPFSFSYFEKQYAESTNNAPFPFSTVVGKAVSRMEINPPNKPPSC